jgi:hypothetical protein
MMQAVHVDLVIAVQPSAVLEIHEYPYVFPDQSVLNVDSETLDPMVQYRFALYEEVPVVS